MAGTVRILNDEGVRRYRDYLSELRKGGQSHPPAELLEDPWCSAKLPKDMHIENRSFGSKMEVAVHLYEALGPLGSAHVDQNVGLWSWMSLFYFDQLCPRRPSGIRRPGQDYRFVLDLDSRSYYRHLLAGPYVAFRLHGRDAALLLGGPPNQLNKYYLELAARQGFVTNKGIIQAANLLYFDPSRGQPKRGPAVTTRRPGTLFRFIDVIQQLDLTYDLHSMSGEEIVSLLPREFEEWRTRRPERSSRGLGLG